MHQLILVEGLPCSGKSTTAKHIADTLHIQYYDENSGIHPADYEYHAHLTESALNTFPEPDRKEIMQRAEPECGGYTVPLAQFQGTLLEKLLQYKIYDALPWETEHPVMLNKWRKFVSSVKPDERFVFNCVFLQNPMCETMLRFGFHAEQSAAYIREIADTIRPLHPLVIYLKSDSIERNVTRIIEERGSEWLQNVVQYHCGGEYGKRHALHGFSGYTAALAERQTRELAILEGLDIDRIILEHPQKNWARTYQDILHNKEYPL